MDAAAGHDQRMGGAGQQVGCGGDRRRVGLRPVQRIGAEAGDPARLARCRILEQVDRHDQDRRAGPAAGRRGEGHVDIVVDAVGLGDAAHPLGDAAEEVEMVQFLEGVAVGRAAGHVLDQGHDRDRGLQRLRRARHQQGRGRPVLRRHHRHPAGDAGIAVGHRRPGILGPVGELADAVAGGDQVEGGRDALAEGDLHPWRRKARTTVWAAFSLAIMRGPGSEVRSSTGRPRRPA